MKKPLRILMVTSFPCIRAFKEAQALKNRGHHISLLCISEEKTKGLWLSITDTIITYESLDELALIIKKITPTYDIVHGHNEPNCHVAYAIAYTLTCPVIYDCHDFSSMRTDIDEIDLNYEKICFEKSDAVVHVSEALQAAANKKYHQKRSIVLYSFPPIKDIHFQKKKKLKGYHVVYEGGLVSDKDALMNYRYYIDYFSALAKAEINIHIFPAQRTEPNTLFQYTLVDLKNTYLHIYKTQAYETLLHTMSAVSWGLTGFYREENEHTSKAIYLDNAMPNKVFDYLIAGVTPIVINAQEVGNFVKKHNIGYVVKNMHEFIDVVKHAPPLSNNLDLTLIDMNKQILKLEKLYYDLLGID